MGCYKNIIDSLRLCGNGDDPVDECGQVDCVCHYGERDSMCRQKVMFDAADAIEELLAENKAIKQSNKDAAMRNKLLCDEISRMKEKVPHWISVEERLPPVYKNVLSCDKYGLVKENYMISDKSWSVGYHITHWMPLPTPPKEDA